MRIIRITKEEWYPLSEKAHLSVFKTYKSAELERIDFALMASENDAIRGYITCVERDSKSIYWQFGGVFDSSRGTVVAWNVFKAFISWCGETYDRVGFLVENSNTNMLHFASKLGFRIIGVRTFKGDILLEHALEFQGEK